MLELRNIKKDYKLKDQEPVHALKGISLNFRQNEFVAILGHSGCGKTTLLNITGGLDHYDEGDLVIKGKSTKNFKDHDWDTYRNHSIGFVFQTYNLIPHQTILKNVELALTISGIKKEERIARAKEALDKVGLEGLYKKKPNQLSGGQMQRVAIARALVNNPEIVLADEPTGALDSETSVQIMDLLKKVSKNHLVIMVTHNPELAEKYATRIVRMKDGKITSDSDPYDGKDEVLISEPKEESAVVNKGKKQSSMSFFTATGLSLSNLWSKFRRTVLVAVAGSIGIIGVSTILGVSCGVNDYIDYMQDDMLSSYPLEVSEQTVDMTSLLAGLSNQEKSTLAQFDTSTQVGMDSMIQYLLTKYTDFTNVKTNEITETLVKFIDEMPEDYYAAVSKDYSIDPTNNFFTAFKKNKTDADSEVISVNGLTQQYIKTLMTVKGFSEYAQFVDLFTSFMKQLPAEKDYLLSQYELLGDSKFPTSEDELLLVVDSKTTLTDLVLAQMGYYPEADFLNVAKKAVRGNEIEKELEKLDKKAPKTPEDEQRIAELKEEQSHLDENYPYDSVFNIEDILNHEFYYYPHSAIYKANPDFVSHNQVSLSLSGKFMGSYTFILGLTYDSGNDALTGTLIVLNSANEIQMNTPLILFRDKSVPVTNPDPSVADGKWTVSASGTELELTIESSDKTVDPTDDKIADFSATGTLKTKFSSFPITVNLTSGKIHEVTPETPDYWYNSTVDKTSEMYTNPASVGGVKVKIAGILRAKPTTNFGTLSRGVYFTKQFAQKYMSDSEASAITTDFKAHILNKRYDVSQFNAYVKLKYDDYSDDDGTEASIHRDVDGYASALNGDQTSSIVSIFASFLNGGTDNLKNDKLHLRAVAGLKVNDIVSETDQSVIDHHEILSVPQTISFYPKNFEKKGLVTSYLDKWNSDEILKIDGVDVPRDERSEISYTDTISMIVTVISTLVTTISIALIAFTSLSLVVSCFMIAVITYISVMERVKEIGVIRSLGGRKKDVSRLFIAENLITGFSSGAFGILVTYILQIIINLIVKFFGVPNICALPWYFALMMVGIAVVLSVISGLIPSLSASKQDPVIALRTE